MWITADKIQSEGWYWWRMNPECTPTAFEVSDIYGEFICLNRDPLGISTSDCLSMGGLWQRIPDAVCSISDFDSFKITNIKEYDIETKLKNGEWKKTKWGGNDRHKLHKIMLDVYESIINGKLKGRTGVRIIGKYGYVYNKIEKE